MAKSGNSGTVTGAYSRRQILAATTLASAGLLASGLRPALSQNASEPIRFGLIKALTGRVASAYAPLYVGAYIAKDEINAAGGILGRKVEIIEADDEGFPAKEPAIVHSLREKKIDILLGPIGTGNMISALSVTNPAKLLQTGGSFAAETADGKAYPYHFQFTFNDRIGSMMAVDYIAKNMKDKKVGIIQDSFPYGEATTKSVTEGLKEKGIALVGTEVFPANTPDIKSYMRILQKAGVEVLVLAVTIPTNAALVFNAMRSIGWYTPIFGYAALQSDALLDLLPAEAIDQVYTCYLKSFSYTATEKPADRQVAYVKKLMAFPETKGQEPNAAQSPFYDAMHVYKWAIEQTKDTDPDKVRAAMETLKDFPGMSGALNLSAENHCGISESNLAWCKISSSRDPRAMGAFRERLA
jgi:branched-chain amino acid transport system substrate-binding protein